MRPNQRVIFVLMLALVAGVLVFVARQRLRNSSPRVSISFFGFIQSSGLAVFTISNASPSTIAYSGRYRIQLPTADGWTNQAAALLPGGAEIRSGQSDTVTLRPPVGEKEWRAEIDVFAHGYFAGKGWRLINQMGRKVGLSLVEPVMYSISSDPVTQSLDKILSNPENRNWNGRKKAQEAQR